MLYETEETIVTERRVCTDFLLMFAPKHWSSVTKFRQIMGPPFNVNKELAKGVNTAENHLAKFSVLAGLANRLRHQLAEDEAELNERGYSTASRSKEYAALVEALFCELYASLDGVRRSLFGAYRKVRGVQNKSTKTLFVRASESKYGPEFPSDICAALTSAFDSWFPRLRRIRTEVTHGDVGSCHVDNETRKAVYIHGGLGSNTRAFVIEDVETELNSLAASVSNLIENVFASLCAKLEPVKKRVMCGIYKGRCYERIVATKPNLSFDDGCCTSRRWFETEAGYECPMRENCGAYHNALANDENSA